MKIADLTNCPQWLKDADTLDADVAFCSCGCEMIIWRDGVWNDGDWHGGVWNGGDWRGGDWRDGIWNDGDWHGGIWRGGVWRGGIWNGGDWNGGDWNGGIWNGGVWHGGIWNGGVWRGGHSTCRSKYIPILKTDKSIQIGCKTKTRDQWDKWFSGAEVYDTPRYAAAFHLVEGHYRALVVWAEYAGLLPRKEVAE